MTTANTQDWQSSNQRRLTALLADLKSELRQHAALIAPPESDAFSVQRDAEPDQHDEPDQPRTDHPAAIDVVTANFHLTRFERDILLLCAGMELDSTVAPLCAAARGDSGQNYPTFSLALAALSEAHWSALTPDGPLRRWRLIELGNGPAMTVAPLRIDERVLHYLAGVSHLDDRLSAMVEPLPSVRTADLAESHRAIADRIAAAWTTPRPPAVQLCAADSAESRPIASAAAAERGLRAMALPMDLIPTSAAELDAFIRLWEREAVLGHHVLLIDCDQDSSSPDEARSRAVTRLIERLHSAIIIAAREPRRIANRSSIQFDVGRPSTAEQRQAWHTALPQLTHSAGIDEITSQFSLGLPAIRSVAANAAARAAASPQANITDFAWQICRARCRTKLDGLAQRIDPAAGWNELVLPDAQKQLLRQIVLQVRHRATVYETWGFAAKSSRGLGIAALFAGASGTGKTMAAEALAAQLRMDLYRIDLASMVSKYIGETEKNLRKVFDAAEESGAILLFDEADALFGKRSEVKDSHDRYANVEVSYLLQRVEAYRGLAILTTNLKSAIDTAFLRRLRFVVQFPFPDATQRAEIWKHAFPTKTPTEGLDPTRLAKLNITGGNICNIALTAAFLAADGDGTVRMKNIRDAARTEYLKLEKPLNEAEIGDWA